MTLHLIILFLAVYRITNLFTDDNEGGPWQSLHWIRWKTGVRYDSVSKKAYGTNVISRALSCFWCFSVWVGLFVAVPYVFWSKITITILLPFALSAGALMIKRYMDT